MADDLTPSESALLIVLMAEAREISNPELSERYQITLTGKSREKLNAAGFVKSDKVGRSFVHQLDDKGWERMHQAMNFDSPRSRALGAALSALHENLRERVLGRGAYHRFSEMFSHSSGTVPLADSPDNLETRIREAYRSLAPRRGAWVKHTAVRERLSDVPDEALDGAFDLLSRADDVEMMPESNQKTLSEADRRYSVRVGGQDTHLIAIGPQ